MKLRDELAEDYVKKAIVRSDAILYSRREDMRKAYVAGWNELLEDILNHLQEIDEGDKFDTGAGYWAEWLEKVYGVKS